MRMGTLTKVRAHFSLPSTCQLRLSRWNILHCMLTQHKDSFGVTGTSREWITSYLTDRTQFVRVGSESSVVTNCSCGVPQRSVLGPLFCVSYISSIAKVTEKFNVLNNQYAVRCFVEKVVDRRSQQPAKLPCCRSHVVHSEWDSHQPRKIRSSAATHSTAIKSNYTAAEQRECCRLCCPIRRRRQDTGRDYRPALKSAYYYIQAHPLVFVKRHG